MVAETILKKISEDGKWHYCLKKISNKYVIFKMTFQSGSTETEIAEKLGEFRDEEKARKLFNQLE